MLGRSKYDSGKLALKDLKLLNLEQRRVVHESVFAHKGLCGKLPTTIQNRYRKYLSKINTRSSKYKKLNIPQHNLSKFKKSPLYRTISSWNKAPKDLPFGKIKPHKTGFQNYLLNEFLT